MNNAAIEIIVVRSHTDLNLSLLPKAVDIIWDATKLVVDQAFVVAYTALLKEIIDTSHSYVLVVETSYLDLFPANCMVVPTLGEAKDIIEMERIERDLGF